MEEKQTDRNKTPDKNRDEIRTQKTEGDIQRKRLTEEGVKECFRKRRRKRVSRQTKKETVKEWKRVRRQKKKEIVREREDSSSSFRGCQRPNETDLALMDGNELIGSHMLCE